MIENELEYLCPSCGEKLSLHIDITGGQRQEFIQDCEVCCRPIRIRIELKAGEAASFNAELSG
jgi:hypothetical protein